MLFYLPEYARAGALGRGLVNKSSYLMRTLATTHGLQVQFVFSSEQQDMTAQLRRVRDMILSYSSLPAPSTPVKVGLWARGLLHMIRSDSFLPARVPLSWGSRQGASILLLLTCPSAPILGL